MRRRIRISKNSKPVIVCGAGLSHAAGVPLQARLAAAVIPDGMARIHNILRGRPSDASIDIEEYLTSIDFEDALESDSRRDSRLTSTTYLLALAVEIYNSTAGTTQSRDVWRRFAEQTATLWELVDTVITTNWDTLLESHARLNYGTVDLLTCRSGL